MVRIIISLVIGCMVSIAWAKPNELKDLKILQTDNATRIILKLDTTTSKKIFSLSNPNRLVVDFTDVRFVATQPEHFDAKSLISSFRKGYPNPQTLRLVFDLKRLPAYKIISAPSSSQIVIDITPNGKKIKNVEPVNVQVVKENQNRFSKSELKPVLVDVPKNHPIVVVLDAGHGGKDPGAIGKNGTREKDVVLAISKKLAAIINQQPNMRAELTRKGDYFVPLRGRLKLARRGKADLFVAVHADSYLNSTARGASVYVLSPHGATSEAARWLAQRDNYSELGGVDLSGLNDQSYVLRSVLIDLAQTATITDSLRLGNLLLRELGEMTRLHYSRVEQAPFMVLKSPDIPSVLVETGFISTPSEEMKLRDPRYQQEIALALFDGIEKYLKKYGLLE